MPGIIGGSSERSEEGFGWLELESDDVIGPPVVSLIVSQGRVSALAAVGAALPAGAGFLGRGGVTGQAFLG